MADQTLRYDKMVEDALRGVLREALSYAAEHGLTGDHHFYITFKTAFPGVVVPDHVRAQYPDEMTIVLQHQFWGLEVTDDAFMVTLSFNRVNERLRIPFPAVTAFADPSAKFGLQFQSDSADDEDLLEVGDPEMDGTLTELDHDDLSDLRPHLRPEQDTEEPRGQVIALDAWRKK